MGCDIHAMIERRTVPYPDSSPGYVRWANAGEPDVDRNYQVFAVLAGVRAERDDWPKISAPRGIPSDACGAMASWHSEWEADAHSASWVTLAEMKAFDHGQTVWSDRLVSGRDKDGNITETCAWSNREYPKVGQTNVFGPWGPEQWLTLIASLEAVKREGDTDEDIRMVFFFDN